METRLKRSEMSNEERIDKVNDCEQVIELTKCITKTKDNIMELIQLKKEARGLRDYYIIQDF